MSVDNQEFIAQSDLEEILEDVISKEAVEQAKIDVVNGSVKGTGYMGVVNEIEVNGSNKKLRVVVKLACKSDVVRQTLPLREAFLREIYFYEKIWPALQKFQKDCSLEEPFEGIPKFLSSCSGERRESLVMENLKTIGFCLWDRKVAINEEHMQLVLKEYAKFHAIGYVMKKKDVDTWNELTDDMNEIFCHFQDKGESFFATQLNDLLKNFENELNENEIERIVHCKSTLGELLKSLEKKGQFATITHGDCWINNMMFKYEDPRDSKKPTTVCFLDFQMVRAFSPVADVSYFLNTSWTEELGNDINHYLNFYYENLNKNFEKYHCDPTDLYPRSAFDEDCRNYFKFGFLMSVLVLKVMLANSEEVPDIRQTETEGKDFNSVFVFETGQNDNYKKRMKTLISSLIENNYL